MQQGLASLTVKRDKDPRLRAQGHSDTGARTESDLGVSIYTHSDTQSILAGSRRSCVDSR
ncbi:hypothetical protein FA13DRAFT_1730067 [Coprinellus micaceus]|uniref:Uncharacterized protein n=1 Tax=Coprinellus micaceus TaxID=71717 RepID=A0A4Y7TJV9_COPMI|nr:hypothetical protein FA13DRAFT_1730067 [Coprinellus micaceus]